MACRRVDGIGAASQTSEMEISAFTTVYSTRTSIEADALIAALRAAGFHPSDLEMSSHFSVAGMEPGFYIEVPTSEAEAAREFIRAG